MACGPTMVGKCEFIVTFITNEKPVELYFATVKGGSPFKVSGDSGNQYLNSSGVLV